MVYPWKCPRKDAKKVTCVVPLPSGVFLETVEFNFEGKHFFQSQACRLNYNWPEKLFIPEVIFKVGMRSDTSVNVKMNLLNLGRQLGNFASTLKNFFKNHSKATLSGVEE